MTDQARSCESKKASPSGLGEGGQADGPSKREEGAILEGIAFARRAEVAERRVEELEVGLRQIELVARTLPFASFRKATQAIEEMARALLNDGER